MKIETILGLVVVAVLVLCGVCLWQTLGGPKPLGSDATPAMPAPSPLTPAPPSGPKPDGKTAPGVVQARRVEILDDSGRVAIVLTTANNAPVAVVNDNGTARTIDLAKVARLAR